MHEAARSAALVCVAMETLQCATRQLVTPAALRQSIVDHLAQHLHVHGTDYWTLKYHLALHLADQYEDDKKLSDTFVTERRHKNPKRFARQALRMTKGFNKMLMEELVCQHLYDWNEFPGLDDHLVHPHPVPKCLRWTVHDVFGSASSLAMSRLYRASDGATYQAGDVALLGAAHQHACGKMLYHLSVDGSPWIAVQFWPVVAAHGPRCNKHRLGEEDARMVPSTDLKAVVSYQTTGTRDAIVRLPMYYMCKESLV